MEAEEAADPVEERPLQQNAENAGHEEGPVDDLPVVRAAVDVLAARSSNGHETRGQDMGEDQAQRRDVLAALELEYRRVREFLVAKELLP